LTIERHKPQLVMKRTDLAGLPEICLPDGYTIRCYEEGDGPAWEQIIGASFGRQVEPGEFDRNIREREAFRPERVLFVLHGDEAVATASAWDSPGWGAQVGQLHMVGVKPGHQGKRLGHWASLGALHQFRAEGRNCVMLSTDDFRLAAVKIYLALDFVPVLVHENQRQRWADVFTALGMPDQADRFADILRGPVTEKKTAG